MRARTAAALALTVVGLFAVGSLFPTTLPTDETPDATFEVTGNATGGIAVEHAAGDSLESGSLRVLVYEDRPVIPDRTVHGSIWETDTGFVQPSDRIELSDPRFEPGQRLTVRWFGSDGQAVLHETTLA